MLGKKWQADHVEPVDRLGKWVGGKWVASGVMGNPKADHIDNLLPACVPCNVNKSNIPLEIWRKRLNDLPDLLQRNYSAWRHAHRFGLVCLGRPQIQFHFETYQPTRIPRVFLLE